MSPAFPGNAAVSALERGAQWQSALAALLQASEKRAGSSSLSSCFVFGRMFMLVMCCCFWRVLFCGLTGNQEEHRLNPFERVSPMGSCSPCMSHRFALLAPGAGARACAGPHHLQHGLGPMRRWVPSISILSRDPSRKPPETQRERRFLERWLKGMDGINL